MHKSWKWIFETAENMHWFVWYLLLCPFHWLFLLPNFELQLNRNHAAVILRSCPLTSILESWRNRVRWMSITCLHNTLNLSEKLPIVSGSISIEDLLLQTTIRLIISSSFKTSRDQRLGYPFRRWHWWSIECIPKQGTSVEYVYPMNRVITSAVGVEDKGILCALLTFKR